MKDSRIAQISGKMLIASSSSIVGAMNIHATILSERPRTLLASGSGVARTAISAARSRMDALVSVTRGFPLGSVLHARSPSRANLTRRGTGLGGKPLHLAVVFEDLGPVLDQTVEGFLGGAVAGNDIVMEALLDRLQQ